MITINKTQMHSLFLCLLASILGILASAASQAAEIRIVDGDKPVKSKKRGLCLNKMSRDDFMAVSPSVSWWYNWHYEDTQNPPKDANMEFFPMVWGDREADLKGIKSYLSKNKPRYIMGINEPNLKDQAFISPEKTARLYKEIKEIADKHDIPVIAPNMAMGSPENGSIRAMDPIEKKEMVYTFQNPFLNAFFHFLGEGVEVTDLASHSYGNLGELKWLASMMYEEYKKPVWITEFAHWHAANDKEELEYLIQAVDFFERAPYVAGYAWFKERVGGNPKLSLLGKSGELTKLGEAYVNMPVHDPDVYYRVPGKVQAESYVEAADPVILQTSDTDGFLEMRALGPQNWLDYNVAVERGGTYQLKIRLASSGSGKVDILAGDQVLASVEPKEKGWQTLETTIALPQANQKIRLQSSSAVKLNWMEFSN